MCIFEVAGTFGTAFLVVWDRDAAGWVINQLLPSKPKQSRAGNEQERMQVMELSVMNCIALPLYSVMPGC